MDGTPTGAAVEVGLVSADRQVVDFYAKVFGLEELPPLRFDVGTLHRLRSSNGIIKVLVPTDAPAPPPLPRRDMGERGLSYLTLRVTDFDGVIARASASGGAIVEQPRALDGDRRLAMVRDPDDTLIEVIEVTPPE